MNGHIAIRLSPTELPNPDADIRYRIPDLISELTQGSVTDNGYDYTEDDTMIVYLSCNNPKQDVETVIRILNDHPVYGNRILEYATIGISSDGDTFDIVHPPDMRGQFTVDPG